MRIFYKDCPELWELNKSLGLIDKGIGVEVPLEKYVEFKKQTEKNFQHMTPGYRKALALHLAMTHPGFHNEKIPPSEVPLPERRWHFNLDHVLQIIIIILILIALVVVVGTKAHAQSTGGSIEFQNAGSSLGTFPGTLIFNCSTNTNCSRSGQTITLTSTGGGAGSGCIPPGTVANSILIDLGGGLCGDTTKFTSNGTTTITGIATSILDMSAGIWKAPTSAGYAPTVSNQFGYDSTANQYVFGQNGTTVSFGLVGGTTCVNQVLQAFHAIATSSPTSTCHTVTSADTSGTFPATAHNLLSSTHGDTVTHSAVLGDLLYANVTPAWQALAGQTTTTKMYLSQTGTGAVSAAPIWAQIAFADLSGTISSAQDPHALLSAFHTDTTVHSVVRGDLIAGIGASPTWTAVAKGGTNTYPKWNASGDVIPSSLAASGVGSPTACSNQVVTAFTLNADAAPTSTCTTITSAFTSGTFNATAHNLLSATHGDTTASSVSRGAIVTGQGASPTWSLLAHGTQFQVLNGGANEPLWDAVHLDQATAVTGILPVGNLPGSGVTTVNSQSCALNASCTIPFQTNTVNNTSQAGINLLTSTANAVGLTITPVNSATNQMKFEISGGSYTGNSATSTAFDHDPTDCSANQYANSIVASGNLGCAQVAYSQLSGTPTLFYQTVQNAAGIGQTQQPIVQFTGTAVTSVVNDGANNRTVVTLTAGAGGTGCTPPGTTGSVLIDDGAGGCPDFSQLIGSGNTMTAGSSLTFDLRNSTLVQQRASAGLTTSAIGDFGYDSTLPVWHAFHNGSDRLMIVSTNLGTAGQAFLSNSDGSGVFADPIVSGPDAVGTAVTKNPVQIGGQDSFGLARAGIFSNTQTIGNEYGLIVRDADDDQQLIQLSKLASYLNPLLLTTGPFKQGISKINPLPTQDQNQRDPCSYMTKSDSAISQTATTKIVNGTNGYLHICKVRIVAGAAEITSELEGTGTNCATGPIAHSGSTTAANGESLAVNGGYQSGDGLGSVDTLAPGKDFCIGQSGSSRVSGSVSYVYANY